MDINLKINELVNILESHGGLYMDINNFKEMTNLQMNTLLHRTIENFLISMTLSQEQKQLIMFSTDQPEYRELCIDLLLFITQYNDEFQNERCLYISQLIQDSQLRPFELPVIFTVPSDLFLPMVPFNDIFNDPHEISSRSYSPAQLRQFAPLESLTSTGSRDPRLPIVDYTDSDTDSDILHASDSDNNEDFDFDNLWSDLNPITHIIHSNEEIKSISLNEITSPNHHNLRPRKRRNNNNSSDDKKEILKRQKKK
jgi:hypothetical protein